jgi:hypothetical protein
MRHQSLAIRPSSSRSARRAARRPAWDSRSHRRPGQSLVIALVPVAGVARPARVRATARPACGLAGRVATRWLGAYASPASSSSERLVARRTDQIAGPSTPHGWWEFSGSFSGLFAARAHVTVSTVPVGHESRKRPDRHRGRLLLVRGGRELGAGEDARLSKEQRDARPASRPGGCSVSSGASVSVSRAETLRECPMGARNEAGRRWSRLRGSVRLAAPNYLPSVRHTAVLRAVSSMALRTSATAYGVDHGGGFCPPDSVR